ncbi:hypothetical protein G647_06509 [Cladophialophora carrionii CBS 160.54]|uniref:Uncharacterized protein n=1 Tax=Cladophialophora carrionii CBS 160.54 TaxID=1279043 RepID=V9D6B0_9EURO|nr:uncharacterized protein G647_06509 [Cladophialophora carrionii CBS 160.54]ETI22434.1 hypothetical protein G647_06509 [Cladophialophora carrionii CBS 160.54]
MSFVDLLFPQAELEALGNKWHEPAPKRRKLESGIPRGVRGAPAAQRRQSYETNLGQERHRLSALTAQQHGIRSSCPEDSRIPHTKRSNSDSQALFPPVSSTSTQQSKHPTSNKSCLPSFIEPSLLRNYLRHLHPKDSHRYTSPSSPNTSFHTAEDAVPSPGSLVLDSAPSPASTDSCPTPGTVCDQFRSGPFGHLFDGMRLTDNERDLMEDLLGGTPPMQQEEIPTRKRRQDQSKVEVAPEDYSEIDESLLRTMFPATAQEGAEGLGDERPREYDVHSSGLSPATEEPQDEKDVSSHRGIVIYDYGALSVDDFFDLDEAST